MQTGRKTNRKTRKLKKDKQTNGTAAKQEPQKETSEHQKKIELKKGQRKERNCLFIQEDTGFS